MYKINNILPIVNFIDKDLHLGLTTCLDNLLEVFDGAYLITGDRTRFGRPQDQEMMWDFYKWVYGLPVEYGMFDITPINDDLAHNRFAWDTYAWSQAIQKNPDYDGYLLMSAHDILRVELFNNRIESGWKHGDGQTAYLEDLDAVLFAACRRYADKDIASLDYFPGPLYFRPEKNPEWDSYLLGSKSKVQFLSCLAGNKVMLSACPKTQAPLFDSLELVGPPRDVCDRCSLNLQTNLYYEMSVESIDGSIVGTDMFGYNRYMYSKLELKNSDPRFYRRNYVSN
jgi:hypothetical protein